MKKTKGIILAGGRGTRLFPLSKVYSKQLIAVYDKPMIYYPFATLLSMGIRDILIIADCAALDFYRKLFDDGSKLGVNIDYALQEQPNGIAEAFIIGEKFIGDSNVALILGDNIFYDETSSVFTKNIKTNKKAAIFAIYVDEPERYGVVKFDENNQPVDIIEKPKTFVSNYAVPGFYIYDSSVVSIAKSLTPSDRGELEITDINKYYLEHGELNIVKINSGVAWLDCGTPDSLLSAGNLIASIEKNKGIKLGCIEEAALNQKFINVEMLKKYIDELPNCDYKKYLETHLLKIK